MLGVEFVSYTGKSPFLCRGTLTIRVKGKEYVFPPEKAFWYSGGSVHDSGVHLWGTREPWLFYLDLLPDELLPYADAIAHMFNAYVPHGCCGGCLGFGFPDSLDEYEGGMRYGVL